jgi:DNA replication protein DnaC
MITTTCSTCGQPVKRLITPTTPVLCAHCCAPSEEAIREEALIDARRRVERQFLTFDAAGSYDSAVLSMTQTPTQWQRKAVAAVNAHRQRLTENSPGRGGILFTGPTGIGKTHAAIAICRRVADFDPAGIRVTTETSLLRPGIPPWELHDHIRRTIDGARTLLIDDVGTVARPQDQVMSAWKQVADLIAASPTSTLVLATTNLTDLQHLSQWVGAQAASRLTGFMDQATTGWTDHRAGVDHLDWKARLRPKADAS